MKLKRIGITEIWRRIWLFSANKIKSSESFSKQPTQPIIKLNSSLRHIIVTLGLSFISKKILTTVTVNSPKMATFESPHFTANDGHCIKICVTFVWAIAFDENGFGPFCRRWFGGPRTKIVTTTGSCNHWNFRKLLTTPGSWLLQISMVRFSLCALSKIP